MTSSKETASSTSKDENIDADVATDEETNASSDI